MNERLPTHGLPDERLDRLLGSLPPPEELPAERREAMWDVIARHLQEMAPIAPTDTAGLAPVPDARPTQVTPLTLSPKRKRQRITVWATAAGLAAAAAAVALILLPGWKSPPDTSAQGLGNVEIARGRCFRASGGGETPLTAGSVLRPGDKLAVGTDGGLKLRWADGSLLWLCEDSEAVCVGPRSNSGSAIRLLRGELRADIAKSPSEQYCIETPAATLRVLGTEFHCRVFPAIEQQEAPTMGSTVTALRRTVPAVMVLTVLSGSVSVQTADGSQVVQGGQRVAAAPGSPTAAEDVKQMDYIRNWLQEPGKPPKPESLVFVPLREYLVHSLWAVDAETGKARHITDVLGAGANVTGRFSSDVAIVSASGVIFSFFGRESISGKGRPLVHEQLLLINLQTGEKIAMTPLRDYRLLYTDLSPDRRKLAFVGSYRPPGTDSAEERQGGVYVLDLETLKTKRVLEGWQKTCPHWSPDSRWLAISKAEGYTASHSIVLIDTVNGDVVETGINGAGVFFTPDGKKILFSAGYRAGSWCQGVPASGNLFLADIPEGKPEQLTQLTDGGAVLPVFSPDGSQLAWWERADPKARLHVTDMKTREDNVVVEGESGHVQWISPDSRLLISNEADAKPDQPAPLMLVERKAEGWTKRTLEAQAPKPTDEQKAAAEGLVKRIFAVFETYKEAIKDQDLHRLDESQKACARARGQLAEIANDLPAGAHGKTPGAAALGLTAQDLEPYLEFFTKEAGITPAERTVEIVRNNLQLLSNFINMYRRKEQAWPKDPETLARWAMDASWQINHISAKDKERASRLFVIPGDDPAKVTTSFKLVKSDDAAGLWVVQTPKLPNGKRLEATYQLKKDGRYESMDTQIKEIP